MTLHAFKHAISHVNETQDQTSSENYKGLFLHSQKTGVSPPALTRPLLKSSR